MDVADAVALLRTEPPATGLFLDFDGTLAPIVEVADQAVPLPGVTSLLLDLQRRFAVVAIVSGRPVTYLAAHLPAATELHGLYGLEARRDGVVAEHERAGSWRPVVDEVAARASAELAGVDVEHKGLSLTLHFRADPARAEAARAWADEAATASGLDLRRAKMSVELHPPVEVDKGTVVESRAAGLSTVAYLGDDVGDLPAFDALARLSAGGVRTLKVAVRTPEADRALLDQADVLVDGPEGAFALLAALR